MSKLLVFKPGSKYPSISITGDKCWLNCIYCRGKYLNNMIQINNPSELLDFTIRMHSRINGLLISGGFNKQGYLPIENYLSVIEYIGRKYCLIMSIHPGLLTSDLIKDLRKTSIEVIDYELILDDYVIKQYKNLDKTAGDYIAVYEEFINNGFTVVPHLVIGLGNLDWINRALDYLTTVDPENIVFLIHMDSEINTWFKALDVFKKTRSRLKCEISLGCMRPYGFKKKIDNLLIENYVIDRIVNPLRETIEKTDYLIYETCCSTPREKLRYCIK